MTVPFTRRRNLSNLKAPSLYLVQQSLSKEGKYLEVTLYSKLTWNGYIIVFLKFASGFWVENRTEVHNDIETNYHIRCGGVTEKGLLRKNQDRTNKVQW